MIQSYSLVSLDGDGYGINGCQLFLNSANNTGTINLGSQTGDNSLETSNSTAVISKVSAPTQLE
jgi:hypothetical protein